MVPALEDLKVRARSRPALALPGMPLSAFTPQRVMADEEGINQGVLGYSTVFPNTAFVKVQGLCTWDFRAGRTRPRK